MDSLLILVMTATMNHFAVFSHDTIDYNTVFHVTELNNNTMMIEEKFAPYSISFVGQDSKSKNLVVRGYWNEVTGYVIEVGEAGDPDSPVMRAMLNASSL